MTSPSPEIQYVGPHRLRSGTAARLAGLPVTTLRVWERRYGVVSAAKTEGGQRAYSPHDVSRLRLLRQLTQSGHAIGTIATLDLAALQKLIGDVAASARPWPDLMTNSPANAGIDVIVVGRSAAHAIESAPGCVPRAVFDDLDQAESSTPTDGRVGALLVRLASLQPGVAERVVKLGAALRAGAVFVVYAFGTEANADVLRNAGVSVRREPVTGRELAGWLRSVPASPSPASVPTALESATFSGSVAPRRFSDEALAQLIEMQSPVACDCLRHMAEIVAQLAGFERYSEECISTGPVDTALHLHLRDTSGMARTMFEQALQRVVTEERLVIRGGPAN